jgi:nucleotide-binding universal stress UspA family protein
MIFNFNEMYFRAYYKIMKTILLPTDFSTNSLNAINFAMKMFKDIDCTFYLLNVQKASSFVSDDLMTAAPSVNLYQAIIDMSKKSLDNLINSITSKFKNSRHELIPIVDYDNFIDAINQICELKEVDLIIMGTKGTSGLEKVIFGSNTIRVMQRGLVPVLAIPENYKYRRLNYIAFLTNYVTKYKREDVSVLLEIITSNHSNLQVLHVSEGQSLTKTQEQNIKLIDNLFADISYKFINLSGKDIFKIVTDYIKLNDINMIAMVNKKHSFFERFFTTHMVEDFGSRPDIPFLVMPKY